MYCFDKEIDALMHTLLSLENVVINIFNCDIEYQPKISATGLLDPHKSTLALKKNGICRSLKTNTF